jgi:leucine dehydrogenase
MGGTRLKAYPAPEDALRDVLRLSGAMTLKQAIADLPYGGGKAVLAVPEVPARDSEERRTLLRRYAEVVDSLHGTYVTAADMNTGQTDMDVVGEVTEHVLGRSPDRGGSGDPAGGTALGVFHAIVAACRRGLGSADLDGRRILIQGCGAVGSRLAVHLADAGAELLVSDVDLERVRATADRVGATPVATEAVLGIECDVFAPCATGPVLTKDTILGFRCGIVAGAANNQLETAEDAERLAERGILYAPDYVVNGGGVIWLAGYETLGWDDAAMQARLAGVGQTLELVFDEAERHGITTAAAADQLADERLAAGRRA